VQEVNKGRSVGVQKAKSIVLRPLPPVNVGRPLGVRRVYPKE